MKEQTTIRLHLAVGAALLCNVVLCERVALSESDTDNISLAMSDPVPPSFQFLEPEGLMAIFGGSGKSLGSGGFGSVETRDVPGWCKSQVKTLAVKKVRCEARHAVDQAEKEAHLLEMLAHYPFASRIYGHSNESSASEETTVFTAMEVLGGTLLSLAPMASAEPAVVEQTEQLALSMAWQAVFAVFVMHGLQVYHHDIKLENIMIKQDKSSCIKNPWLCTLKIIDFGVSCTDIKTAHKLGLSKCDALNVGSGTLDYMAPEVAKLHKDKGYDGDVLELIEKLTEAGPEKDDSYALGVSLLRLWYGTAVEVTQALQELLLTRESRTEELIEYQRNALNVKGKKEEIQRRKAEITQLQQDYEQELARYSEQKTSPILPSPLPGQRPLPAWLANLIQNLVHPDRAARWTMTQAKTHVDVEVAARFADNSLQEHLCHAEMGSVP
eukprot:CAMPEP_0197629470 /NCGR_PEP_ID=MMETSP1338-20131121/7302_1 /TAXON_ID=43686 ORGANISM="Pelagodinium beii, Strain RCC1491" /NCGR_SAMPLE_ID=MMETSP1338 /ASSEMBLY_ACC=CAM_ASM_000754 /LENGTH=439 /DNA_ID=CAMNT_0043200509 /DNA_START=80 /DNA_END=1400 /DNA_ORIENTATION=+